MFTIHKLALWRGAASLGLCAALVVSSACSGDAPASAPHNQPDRIVNPAYLDPGAREGLQSFGRALDRELQDASGTPRMVSETQVGGRSRRLHPTEVRDQVRSILSAKPTTFAIPFETEEPLSITGMSLVWVDGNRMRFASITTANKPPPITFITTANRQMSMVSRTGSIGPTMWTRFDSVRVVSHPSSTYYHEWSSHTFTSGCNYAGSLMSGHRAYWPSNAPPGIFQVGAAASVGSAVTSFPCPVPTPPPPPIHDGDPLCDDDSYCPPGNSGGGGYNGGEGRVLPTGYGGGIRTFCWVTDWYVNGVYVETVVDYCWSEPG